MNDGAMKNPDSNLAAQNRAYNICVIITNFQIDQGGSVVAELFLIQSRKGPQKALNGDSIAI
jgi:hypothetical protein